MEQLKYIPIYKGEIGTPELYERNQRAKDYINLCNNRIRFSWGTEWFYTIMFLAMGLLLATTIL